MKIDNVSNLEHLFSNCNSLSSLPDISKWNTNNVINMPYIFNDCNSLSSLPDISKWNIKNITNMEYLFSYLLYIFIIFTSHFKLEYK